MNKNIDSDTEDVTLTVEYIDEADFPFAFSLLAKKYEDLLNGTLKNKKERFDPKLYYEKNKDKYVKYYATRKNKISNQRIHCDLCNCDYYENHESKHIKTQKHIRKELEDLKQTIDQIKTIQENDVPINDPTLNKLYLNAKANLKRIPTNTTSTKTL
jgi:hypothetical protein